MLPSSLRIVSSTLPEWGKSLNAFGRWGASWYITPSDRPVAVEHEGQVLFEGHPIDACVWLWCHLAPGHPWYSDSSHVLNLARNNSSFVWNIFPKTATKESILHRLHRSAVGHERVLGSHFHTGTPVMMEGIFPAYLSENTMETVATESALWQAWWTSLGPTNPKGGDTLLEYCLGGCGFDNTKVQRWLGGIPRDTVRNYLAYMDWETLLKRQAFGKAVNLAKMHGIDLGEVWEWHPRLVERLHHTLLDNTPRWQALIAPHLPPVEENRVNACVSYITSHYSYIRPWDVQPQANPLWPKAELGWRTLQERKVAPDMTLVDIVLAAREALPLWREENEYFDDDTLAGFEQNLANVFTKHQLHKSLESEGEKTVQRPRRKM